VGQKINAAIDYLKNGTQEGRKQLGNSAQANADAVRSIEGLMAAAQFYETFEIPATPASQPLQSTIMM
jgi:hypothetical protein